MDTDIDTDTDPRGGPTVRARVPEALANALGEWAAKMGGSRSDALRDLLTTGLAERGFWPPRVSHGG